MLKIALDNDIVAKCAAYCLLSEVAAALAVSLDEIGVLGTAAFVIKERRLRTASIGAKAAHKLMREFLDVVEKLEPTEEESRLAAQLEETAMLLDLPFDVGESQLCSIVVLRRAILFCTGDKRAIRSLQRLVASSSEIAYLKQRVLPLEGLIKLVLEKSAYARIRQSICASPGTDKALEICFQCHCENGEIAEALAGIDSYVGAIAKEAPSLLSPGGLVP